jgi:hypothetical protein
MISIHILSAVALLLSQQAASKPVQSVSLPAPAGAHEPQIAFRGDHVLVVFGTEDAVKAAESRDGGRSFGILHGIARPGRLALGLRRGPRVATTARGFVVTAIAGEKGRGKDENLFAWRSSVHEDGLAWSSAVRINGVDGSAREGLHALAAGPSHELAVIWIDLRDGKSVLYGSASKDGGSTWSEPAVVYRSPDGSICECCHPSLAFDERGVLHAMWRNQLDGARDLYVAESQDGGRTFGAARKQGTGSWKITACPMDGGGIAGVGADEVVTVWRRESKIFRAGGTGEELELGSGQQPVIASGPGGAWIAWSEGLGGRLVLLRPGATEPFELAPSAVAGVLAGSLDGKGPVFAAWEASDGALQFARVDG